MKRAEPSWIELLSDEDRTFLKRFLLNSGSLKDLAGAYGVSYPTVRQRLDRLIDKVKVIDQLEGTDAFERVLRGMLAEGAISLEAFKGLLAAYRKYLPAEVTGEPERSGA
jgi:hypothetical protein